VNERRAFGLVIRLAVYYAALAGVASLVARSIPQWGALFAEKTPGAAAVAMLGALALMSPVAWMYMRTKPKLRYDPWLVQTVIVLPVVISGVSESTSPGQTALTFFVRLRTQTSVEALLAALRRDTAARITAVRFEPDLQ